MWCSTITLETSHHNIIYATLNFHIPLLPLILRKYEIIKIQILEGLKNRNIILIQLGLQNRNCNEKCKILSETLLNMFHNFIPHRINKSDYKTSEWFNKLIKLSLKMCAKD